MGLSNDLIQQKLEERFKDVVLQTETSYDMLSVEVAAPEILNVLQFLFDDQELKFRFLTDLTAVHYPAFKDRELAVVYHLHNLVDNCRIRIKVFVPVQQPDVPSAVNIFSAANWLERETYDFFGINFTGHPNLIRIQNVEEMDYFPLRKEFPLEDQTRIDKDDEMFGRGGNFDFGNRQSDGSPTQIPESTGGNTQ
jgi:NADH-quinone oxidoreductase subunit C